ncbi:MAG TPA: NIL domain-containing protein [Candidatus Methylomirabilis sp.]
MGAGVATRRLSLTYPQGLIKEPVIYKVAKEYRLVPNIRRARVTESTGEVLVDFSGAEEDLNRGVMYLTGLGITVKEVRE